MGNLFKTGLVALTLSLSAFGFGQEAKEKEAKTPEERAEMHTKKMKKELSLTDEQTTKIKAFNLEAAKQHDVLMQNKTLKVEQRKKANQEIEQKRATNIRSILTSTQATKFDALMKEREEHKEEKKEQRKEVRKEKKKAATVTE